jgi:glycerophosphoryl diester phosphodiesterase
MKDQFICFAHRGASGYEPENTFRSFAKALELGARWIECDARVVENTAIIFHDRTLQRMAGTRGVVAKQTLAHLQSLSLPKGERIPLLGDVLSQLKEKVSLQIELKGQRSGKLVASELLQAVKQGWDLNSLLVSSFDYEELMEFKKEAPSIPLGLLTYGYPLDCLGIAQRMGVYSVHLHIDAVTERRVEAIQKAGYKVFVYTVNEIEDIDWLKSLSVDGVFSDYPDRVLSSAI